MSGEGDDRPTRLAGLHLEPRDVPRCAAELDANEVDRLIQMPVLVGVSLGP